MGRPSKLTPELLQKAREYIVSCVDSIERDDHGKIVDIDVNLPSIEGLADYLEIARATAYDWSDKKSPRYNAEFSDILEAILKRQILKLFSGGLSGKYNAMIVKLLLAKHGYKEAQDITSGDKPIDAVNIRIIDGPKSTSQQSIPEELPEPSEDSSECGGE